MEQLVISKTIPVVEAYDVVVAGGGPAGFIAAVAAARNGAKTALVEKNNFLGGTATAGLVSPISEFKKNGRRIIGGLPWEFVERLEEMGAAITDYPIGNIPFDVEAYKLAAQRMVLEAGVELFLNTYITGVQMEGSSAAYLLMENKSGSSAVKGRMFIDATGDGDVAAAAGVPMQEREEELQPATLFFRLGGVDTEHLENIHLREENTRYSNKRVSDLLKALPEEEVPPFGGPWFITGLRDGIVNVNITRRAMDITDARQAAKTECMLREDVAKHIALLREYVPEFRDCYLLETASNVGVRESRRIVGKHMLTGEEFVRAQGFEDTIARGAHPVDIHVAKNEGQKVEFVNREGFIPFGSLYAPGFPNLLVAGRCLSADRRASASVRVEAPCMAMGQAAGTAAALCCRRGCGVEELPVALLQEVLLRQKAIL